MSVMQIREAALRAHPPRGRALSAALAFSMACKPMEIVKPVPSNPIEAKYNPMIPGTMEIIFAAINSFVNMGAMRQRPSS